VALQKYIGLSPCAGATVSVFDHGTLTFVSLFEDLAGLVPLANPFTADSRTGVYRFVADDGSRYDIQIDTALIDPSIRTPDAELYVVASGVTPNRFITLIAEDQGEQIILAQITI
jgi:hypothetical protein